MQSAQKVHIVFVVSDDDRLARGAGRGVQLHHFVERHGEHAVGKRLAQRLLVGERKQADVVEGLDVGRRNACGIHALAIPGNAVVGSIDLVDQARELNRLNALAACAFD